MPGALNVTPPALSKLNATTATAAKTAKTATAAKAAAKAAAEKAAVKTVVKVVPTISLPHMIFFILLGMMLGILLAYLLLKRKMVPKTGIVAKVLQATTADADAVGIILDHDRNSIDIVPLRRLAGGLYVYDVDGDRRVFFTTINKTFNFRGKPAFVGLQFSKTSFEVDPYLLMSYGIARIALPEDVGKEMDKSYNPRESLANLFAKLAGLGARYLGTLKPIGGIAFEVSPINLVKSLLNYLASLTWASLSHQRDFWTAIETTAKEITAQRTPPSEWGKLATHIAIAIAIITAVLFMMNLVMRVGVLR